MSKINRNDPCPCGSGKKYKQCCVDKPTLPKVALAQPVQSVAQQFQLAALAFQRGNLGEALTLSQAALKRAPRNAEIHHLIGAILQGGKRLDEAKQAVEQALKLDPRNAKIFFTAAGIAAEQGQRAEVIRLYRSALQFDPSMWVAWFNLGNALRDHSKFNDAVDAFKRAVALKPDFFEGLVNLAEVLRDLARHQEAGQYYERALTLKPDVAFVYSNWLLSSQYCDGLSAQELFARHLRFGQQFEAPFRGKWPLHTHVVDATRRLKIGYVSGDLRQHSVAYFMEPVFKGHDKQQFEVTCYSTTDTRDAMSERIVGYVDRWVDCVALSDDQMAAKIGDDAIDILIDLSGHTPRNRLPVFARKPAPVQMTWIGYPGTTGLQAVDYRITDHYMDPVGATESTYTEALVRLTQMTPFKPSEDSPPVGVLPALSGQPFTFACLNNVVKLNAHVFEVWAAILKQVPGSRMILGNMDHEDLRAWVLAQFKSLGIESDRLILKPRLSKTEYLSLHREIDLALDCFPYSGGTTTMHSIWMGVPVIVLRGDRAASMQGVTNMSSAGFPEFVSQDEADYVRKAVEFASDLERLNHIRQSMRAKMAIAQSGDGQGIVRELEQIYRQVWRTWCEKQQARSVAGAA